MFGSPYHDEIFSIEEHRWRFEPIFLKRYDVGPAGIGSGVAVDIDAEYTAFSPDSLAAVKERIINVPGSRMREVKAIDPSGNIFIHSYISPDYSRIQLKPGEYFGYEDEKIEVYDRDGKLCAIITDAPKKRMDQAIHYHDFTIDGQGNFYQLQAVNPRVNPGQFVRIWKWERTHG